MEWEMDLITKRIDSYVPSGLRSDINIFMSFSDYGDRLLSSVIPKVVNQQRARLEGNDSVQWTTTYRGNQARNEKVT